VDFVRNCRCAISWTLWNLRDATVPISSSSCQFLRWFLSRRRTRTVHYVDVRLSVCPSDRSFVAWWNSAATKSLSVTCFLRVKFMLYLIDSCRPICDRSEQINPLTSTWPHLRCDVGPEEGEYRENCLCRAVLCTIIMVHKRTSGSYMLVCCIGL